MGLKREGRDAEKDAGKGKEATERYSFVSQRKTRRSDSRVLKESLGCA